MAEPHRGGLSSDLLAGITVVEFGDDVGVRYCRRLFAALGARVLHAAQARNDTGLGFGWAAGEAYGAWLDERKARLDPAELSGATCALVIGGLAQTEIARAERFVAAHPDRPAVLALARFDPAEPYGDWTGSDEVMAALSGVAFPSGEAEGPPMLAQGHGGIRSAAASLTLRGDTIVRRRRDGGGMTAVEFRQVFRPRRRCQGADGPAGPPLTRRPAKRKNKGSASEAQPFCRVCKSHKELEPASAR